MALLYPYTAEDEPDIRVSQDSGPWFKSSRASGRSFDQRGEVAYVVGARVTSALAGGFVYAASRVEFAVSHDWRVSWPWRLFELADPEGLDPGEDPREVRALAWRVARELPNYLPFGPKGARIVALMDWLASKPSLSMELADLRSSSDVAPGQITEFILEELVSLQALAASATPEVHLGCRTADEVVVGQVTPLAISSRVADRKAWVGAFRAYVHWELLGQPQPNPYLPHLPALPVSVARP